MPYEDKLTTLKEVIRLMTANQISEVTLGDICVVKHHHEAPSESLTPEEAIDQSQEELEKDLFYSSST